MKRGGGLHPARPDWSHRTERPQATPAGLSAASLTYLSPREGVPLFLRTSLPLGRTLGAHRTSWHILLPSSLFLCSEGAWFSHAPPQVPKQRRP